MNKWSHLEQGFSLFRIKVVDILFPLEECMLVNDIQLVAVDKGSQQDAVGEALAMGPNLFNNISIISLTHYHKKLQSHPQRFTFYLKGVDSREL